MNLPFKITVVTSHEGDSRSSQTHVGSLGSTMLGVEPSLKHNAFIAHLQFIPKTGELLIAIGLMCVLFGCAAAFHVSPQVRSLVMASALILSLVVIRFTSKNFAIPLGLGLLSADKNRVFMTLSIILVIYTLFLGAYCAYELPRLISDAGFLPWLIVIQIAALSILTYLNKSQLLVIEAFLWGLFLVLLYPTSSQLSPVIEIVIGLSMIGAGVRRFLTILRKAKSHQVYAQFDIRRFTSPSPMIRYFCALFCCNYFEPRFLPDLFVLAQDDDKTVARHAFITLSRMWGPSIQERYASIDAIANQIKQVHKIEPGETLPPDLALRFEAMKQGALDELKNHYGDMQFVVTAIFKECPEVPDLLIDAILDETVPLTDQERALYTWSITQMCAKTEDHKLLSQLVQLVQKTFHGKKKFYKLGVITIAAFVFGGPSMAVHLKKILNTAHVPVWAVIKVLDTLRMLFISSGQIDIYNRENHLEDKGNQQALLVRLMGNEIMQYRTHESAAIRAHALWLYGTISLSEAYQELAPLVHTANHGDDKTAPLVRKAAYETLQEMVFRAEAFEQVGLPFDYGTHDEEDDGALIARIKQDLDAIDPVDL